MVENKIGRSIESNADWGRVLREFRKTEPEVLEQVADITGPGQEAYADMPQLNLTITWSN